VRVQIPDIKAQRSPSDSFANCEERAVFSIPLAAPLCSGLTLPAADRLNMNRPNARPFRFSLSQRRLYVLCLMGVLVAITQAVQAQAVPTQSLRRSAVVRAVERAKPSVVNITGQKLVPRDDHFSSEKKRVNGMGTGVVVHSRGYILTNYHVVEGVRRIRVTLANGHPYIARLVAHDPITDLAIIKIPVNYRMPVLEYGSSRDIMTGETVIAVGNAYGYEHTVTTGIVSAQHRNVQVNETQSYQDLIQTDASINPGNSGGPLLNIDGQMIGINVAVRQGAQGIGFAIPVDQGMQVAARLMSLERISNLWHGVIHEDKAQGSETQVVVRNIIPGSPAERAGLRKGDVILQVAGKQVGRGLDLECALIDSHAGQSVEFAVNRDSQPVAVNVGLANKTESGKTISQQRKQKRTLADVAVRDQTWEVLGLKVESVSKNSIGAREFRGGLNVLAVKPSGLAAANGIQRGDVLVGVHVWETINPENLDYILSDADLTKETTVPFYVVRKGDTLRGQFEVSKLR